MNKTAWAGLIAAACVLLLVGCGSPVANPQGTRSSPAAPSDGGSGGGGGSDSM